MVFNFKFAYGNFDGPSVPGQPDDIWTFQFQPIIPFTLPDKPNILRLTVPYQLAGRSDEGKRYGLKMPYYIPMTVIDGAYTSRT
jgi:hypothetical protein